MAGILTKGITLGYKVGSETTYTVITDLMECPSLGGVPEKVDVTTLTDGNKCYIKGLKEFEDLAFKFLYDNSGATSNYRVVRGLEEDGEMVSWEVTFPDDTTFTFEGEVTASMEAAAVNAPLTFIANITLNSDIVVGNPS